MKKSLLSAFIILTFVTYTLLEKSNSSVSPKSSPSMTPSSSDAASSSSTTPSPSESLTGGYKDGSFIGNSVDAFYGNVQVKAVINNGRVVDVVFLDYPSDRHTSQEINSQATPLLRQEAIQTQTASVDIISGATATSQAFIESLSSALNQAK